MYRAFSESPLFLFFFCPLMPRFSGNRHKRIVSEAYYLALRGMVSPHSPIAFFAWLARSPRAGGADSVKPCPTIGGHPKGVGLEGIRGASYALTVPAKRNQVLCASDTRDKLQVQVFPHYSFEGFGDLAVQSSLEPSDCEGIWYSNSGGGVGYLYQRCAGESCCFP